MADRKQFKSNQRLRHAREMAGQTQEQLAEALGTTPFSVHRWEKGSAVPSLYYRQKLCEHFQMSAAQLDLTSMSDARLTPDPFDAGDPGIALHSTLPPVAPLGTQMIGREKLLQQLHTAITAPSACLALSGLPGVGKTALATEFALAPTLRSAFPDGILWAGLGPTPNLLALLKGWGIRLGISAEELAKLPTVIAHSKALSSVLATRRMLLVIDDAWTIDDALAFKIGGLPCAHLVTTRFPLLAQTFAPDRAFVVEELDEAMGVALLVSLAHLEQKHLRPLVQAVGGLPLALTLIGRYLAQQGHFGQSRRVHLALKQLAKTERRLQLSEARAPLEQPPGLAHSTAISVEGVIAVSVQHLSDDAQTLLSALAVFPPKPNIFLEEAALAVSGYRGEEGYTPLDELVDAGLLETTRTDRYTLHQTIVDYAHITRPNEQAQRRMAIFYAEFIDAHHEDFHVLDGEFANIQAALAYAQTHLPRILVHGVGALTSYLLWSGMLQTANAYFTAVNAVLPQIDDSTESANVWYLGGMLADLHGKTAEAEQYAQQGMKIARSLHDERLLCHFAYLHSLLAMRQGRLEEAETWGKESLLLARHIRSNVYLKLLRVLGSLAFKRGDIRLSDQYFEEGLAVASERGNQRHEECSFLQNLGVNAAERGAFESAKDYFERALLLARQEGSHETLMRILHNVGIFMLEQRLIEQAEALFQEGLSYARASEHQQMICAYLTQLGRIAMKREDETLAFQFSEEGMAIAQATNDRERQVALLLGLADIALHFQRLNAAARYIQDGLLLVDEMHHRNLRCHLLQRQGSLAIQRQDWDAAETILQELLDSAGDSTMTEIHADSLFKLAKIDHRRQRFAAAQQHAQQSLSIFHDLHAPYAATDVERWLAEISPSSEAEV